MWKNIWPILVLGAMGYAYYTGWNPLAGRLPVPAHSPGTQLGGPAVVREVEQVPQALQEMPNVTGSAAGPAQAARQAAQQAAGGNR
ncbi:MAG: hypothetical protein ACHQ9S_03620 [Candidatus Binatia bacterium]